MLGIHLSQSKYLYARTARRLLGFEPLYFVAGTRFFNQGVNPKMSYDTHKMSINEKPKENTHIERTAAQFRQRVSWIRFTD
jgi:hypothetical protein